MVRAGLAVGAHTRKESSRRDSGQIKNAEKRIQDQHKNYRVARRQAKQSKETRNNGDKRRAQHTVLALSMN